MKSALQLLPRVPLWLQVIRLDHGHRDDRELARHASRSASMLRNMRDRALHARKTATMMAQAGSP